MTIRLHKGVDDGGADEEPIRGVVYAYRPTVQRNGGAISFRRADPVDAPGFYSSKKAGRKVLKNMEQAATEMMADFVSANLKKWKKVETRIAPMAVPYQARVWMEDVRAGEKGAGSSGGAAPVRRAAAMRATRGPSV